MAITLILVIGLPGAGKTTLCLELYRRLAATKEVHHINYDDRITDEAFSREEGASWKKEREHVVTAVRELLDRLRQEGGCAGRAANDNSSATLRDHLLLLDDNFYYQSMRHPFSSLAKDYRCGFGYLTVNTPTEVCVANDAKRRRPVGADVISRMASKIEWPDLKGTAWDRHFFAVSDVTRVDWPALETFLTGREAQPLSRDEEEAAAAAALAARAACRQNLIHQADIVLRRLIKEHMTAAGSSAPKSLPRQLSESKKAVLLALRTDQMHLHDDMDIGSDAGLAQLELVLRHSFTERLKS